jgi:hypothetical protein
VRPLAWIHSRDEQRPALFKACYARLNVRIPNDHAVGECFDRELAGFAAQPVRYPLRDQRVPASASGEGQDDYRSPCAQCVHSCPLASC